MRHIGLFLLALGLGSATANAATCPQNGQGCTNTLSTDGAGNVVSPATAGNQSTANTSLSTIATQSTATASATGTTADTAWSGSGTSTLVAALKAIYGKLTGTLTATLTGALPAGTNSIGSVTTTPSATVPHAYSNLPSATVTTSSAPLYTYGTPASVLNLRNAGTSNVWINPKGTPGGNCDAAVVSTGIELQPGDSYLFGAVVPLPNCALTAIAASGSDSVAEAGY